MGWALYGFDRNDIWLVVLITFRLIPLTNQVVELFLKKVQCVIFHQVDGCDERFISYKTRSSASAIVSACWAISCGGSLGVNRDVLIIGVILYKTYSYFDECRLQKNRLVLIEYMHLKSSTSLIDIQEKHMVSSSCSHLSPNSFFLLGKVKIDFGKDSVHIIVYQVEESFTNS